jgi:hypothetical protein
LEFLLFVGWFVKVVLGKEIGISKVILFKRKWI